MEIPAGQAISEDFLAAGIHSSEGLAHLGESLIQGQHLDLYYVDATLFPAATLCILERWAAMQHVAALLVLANPPVAHSAIALLRGVVEAYAHAFWISQGKATGPDSQACRALCFERGAAKEMREAVTNAAVGIVDQGQIDEADYRLKRIDDLRTKTACRACKGRDHGDVLPTIKEIATLTGVPWLGDLVRTTRMAAHQLQPDRLLKLADDGAVEIGGPAGIKERAALLQWLTLTYSSLLRVISRVLAPTRESEIDEATLPVRRALGGVVLREGPL